MHNDQRSWRALLAAAALLAALGPRQAGAHEIDLIEHVAGATNIQAIAGAGGLTIGVARDGDLSVLSWPSPSYDDQLSYLTSNAEDAREQPRFGADEGMGAFAGLVVSLEGEESLTVTWLRDAPWTSHLCYYDQRSSVITTTFENPDLGLEVVQTDLVDEQSDLWVRSLEVTRGEGSPVTEAWALLYSNLSPTLSRIAEVPLADWALETRNDFAAVYDQEARAIVHFHPGDTGVITQVGALLLETAKDYGPIGEALREEGQVDLAVASELAARLDDDFAPGVYLALGSEPAADAFQVGFDETDLCGPLDEIAENLSTLTDRYPDFEAGGFTSFASMVRCQGGRQPGQVIRERQGWLALAGDALADARDGQLEGAPLAAGQVNEALRAPLLFADVEGSSRAVATFYLAAAQTAAEARAALADARALPVAALVEATAQAQRDWLAPLSLPDAAEHEPLVTDFAARTLLNLRVGTDRETGAIVASISRQPPYGEDWPRDGAFFNAALDVAGLPDLVTRRLRFYASLQRTAELEPTPLIDLPGPGFPDDPENLNYPADSWEMNYYADGMPGGNIRWEIDNTALLLWSFVWHAGYLPFEDARLEYLEEVYPNIQRAADLLTFWRDEATYLPWPANEDDNLLFTSGLQGAGTSLGALRAAAMAARALDRLDDAERWELRAAELRWAIDNHLYDDSLGFIEDVTENPGSAGAGASSWLAWPEHAFAPDDPRVLAQLERNLDEVASWLDPDSSGGAYLTKTTTAVALAHPDPEIRARALELALTMITDVADPDTLYLGEVFAPIDDDGDGLADRFDNRVSTPHLWAATLVYLTVMASDHPELFDRHEEVLPEAEIPAEVEPPPQTEDGGPDGGQDGGTDGGADGGQDGAPSPAFAGSGGACDCGQAPSRSTGLRALTALLP